MSIRNKHSIIITVDVEDWFQVENLRQCFSPTEWGRQETRVEKNITRLLDLFDSKPFKVKCTFFILGWVAQRFPELIRKIQSRGHELASHGYSHLLNNSLNEIDLRQDLDKSKKLIEDISGESVSGYRAPSFSINDHVLQLIKETGYLYDSSYNSFERHKRYGRISTDGCKRVGAAIEIDRGFAELPVSNLSLFGQVLPWGGGGYFRLLPTTIFLQGVKRILRDAGVYHFYIHPWEIDPQQPKVNGAKKHKFWRHYLNLDKTYKRLGNFISEFQTSNFNTCSQYLKTIDFYK